MATYRELQDRINLDYLNRTDLGAETKRAIIRAIKHYEKERFWFNLTATAIAVGTASTTVALPADFLTMEFATVSENGNQTLLTQRSFDRIAYQNRTGTSGVPAEICWWRDTLQFAPKPSSATSITLHYTHALPALSADADSNAWTSACEDLIVFHAAYDMMANVLRVGDPNVIQGLKTLETESFTMLQHGNAMRQGIGEEGVVVGANQGQVPKTSYKTGG